MRKFGHSGRTGREKNGRKEGKKEGRKEGKEREWKELTVDHYLHIKHKIKSRCIKNET